MTTDGEVTLKRISLIIMAAITAFASGQLKLSSLEGKQSKAKQGKICCLQSKQTRPK